MLRRTLLVFAAGALLHASGAVAAQQADSIPAGTPTDASPGTVGAVAYDGPDAVDFFFGNVAFANTEFADDLHLIQAGNLVSFDFTVLGQSNTVTTMSATVRFYDNDPFACPPGALIASYPVSNLPVGIVWTQTVDVAPVPVPQDVWMGVTITTPGVTGSLTGAGILAPSDASAKVGSSGDLFFSSVLGCVLSSSFTGDDGNFNVTVRLEADLVQIDIKPGSFPNSINLGSKGVTPVAIFSSVGFDATQVDPTTVRMEDAVVKVKGNGTPQASFQDVNGDGMLDLVLQLETEGLALTNDDEDAHLDGALFDSTLFYGTDSVRVVP